MKTEVSFNNESSAGSRPHDCFGSMAVWLKPFDGDIDTFDRRSAYIDLAEDAAKNGFQINPLFFGFLGKYTDSGSSLYIMAGIEDFLNAGDENDQIFHTPEAWYSCVSRPDLDIRAAESVWPDYFAQDYDKIVLATVSLQSNSSQTMYSLFINKPPKED